MGNNMSAIGSINFNFDDGFQSGIALLLVKPPKEEICEKYDDCQLIAAPGTPYLICRFSGTSSITRTFKKGNQLAQKALDKLSMSGHCDLLTHDVEDEHLLWWEADKRRKFIFVSTVSSPIKMSPVIMTVYDDKGNIVTSKPIISKYHKGFRFYRLSQTSEDLYDAYRNMFLAFESLLSSYYPPQKNEKEIVWIRRAMNSASSDLLLQTLVKPGVHDHITNIINMIYKSARLPLFHAKDGRSYFAPLEKVADRKVVSNALNLLTQIVLRMADRWFKTRRLSGYINLNIFKEHSRSFYQDLKWIFSDKPIISMKSNPKSVDIKDGFTFAATLREKSGNISKQNIFGEFEVSMISSLGKLNSLYIVKDSSVVLGLTPDTTINLDGFDDFQVELFIRYIDSNTPKYIYPR